MYVDRNKSVEFRKLATAVKVIALVGPRQCGKTTLLKHHAGEFHAKYLTFDDPDVREIFDDIKKFENTYLKHKKVTILDEVQYGTDPGIKLKYLADKGHKLWITSSTESILASSVLSYLVGRVSIQRLFPFNLCEMTSAKGYSATTDKIEERIISEHSKFGGYPAIVLSDDDDLKITLLRDLLEAMMLKDVTKTYSISDVASLEKLARYLAINNGSALSMDGIGSDLDLSFPTVKKYIDALIKSYLIVSIPPFYSNKNLEIKKKPRYYFLDTGLKNSMLNDFTMKAEGRDIENYVISELIKNGFKPKYWRTKAGTEVDIILEIGREIVPIEVKTKIPKLKVGRGFRSFIEKYKPKRGFFVGLDVESDQTNISKCKINSISILQLLDELEKIRTGKLSES